MTGEEDVLHMIQSPSACLSTKESPNVGVCPMMSPENKDKIMTCSSPHIYMMMNLLSSVDNQRAFMIFQNEYLTTPGLNKQDMVRCQQKSDTMFFLYDEDQFLREMMEACHTAYTHLFERSKEASDVLSTTKGRPLSYRGGFRPLSLDCDENGYGFNIVGKTLEYIRDGHTKKKTELSWRRLVHDEKLLGMMVLAIEKMWVMLTQGNNNLVGFLGKSVFEILVLTGTQWDDTLLQRRRQDIDCETSVFHGLTSSDLLFFVEMELRYPGNLAGFLRKRGYDQYLTAKTYSLYSLLWGVVSHKVLLQKFPDIEPHMRDVYVAMNTSKSTVLDHGPRLVRLFLDGRLTIDEQKTRDRVVDMIHVVFNQDAQKDAIFFVPRRYVLQGSYVSMENILLFDFVDKDEPLDMLSPSYHWKHGELTLDNRVFPSVLHYMLYRAVLLYQKDHVYHKTLTADEKDWFFSLCVYESSKTVLSPLSMESRFVDIMTQRRQDLLKKGFILRFTSTPSLSVGLVYCGLNDQLHHHDSTDTMVVLKELFTTRHEWMKELAIFVEVCHSHGIDADIAMITLRVWTTLWIQLISWIKTVVHIYTKKTLTRDDGSVIHVIDMFFAVFYPDLSTMFSLQDENVTESTIGQVLFNYFMSHTSVQHTRSILDLLNEPRVMTLLSRYMTVYMNSMMICQHHTVFECPSVYTCTGTTTSVGKDQGVVDEKDRLIEKIRHFSSMFERLCQQCVSRHLKWNDTFLSFLVFMMDTHNITLDTPHHVSLPPTRVVYYTPNPRDKSRPKKHTIELDVATRIPRHEFDTSIVSVMESYSSGDTRLFSDPKTTKTRISFLLVQ